MVSEVRQPDVDPEVAEVYRRAVASLRDARLPFLVGGAWALAWLTGITRRTKDLDLFVHRRDATRVLDALAAAGFETETRAPHWLGKAWCGVEFVDLIWGSANGLAVVDDEWFDHAIPGTVLGHPVALCPWEETIWSKAWVMDRERFDGADVAHILRVTADKLDWHRLLRRFDGGWHVLLSHLLLFGFVYPGERPRVPPWIMRELLQRAEAEVENGPEGDALCRGTLFSTEQYRVDVERWGYADGRLAPFGRLAPDDLVEGPRAARRRRR
ncbi:MAG: nucleotidyltransferase family protein [Myxococcota bacterium]